MNQHIYTRVEARTLKKVTLLCLAISVSVILIVLTHFSLSTSPTNTTTVIQYHRDEVANSGSAFKETNGNSTNTGACFNEDGPDNQTGDNQPDTASCLSAVNSSETKGQVSDVPNSENNPLPTPLPDGRIFARGDLPYGYLPTCSPKDKGMPFVPIEPD
jgi:hypothetical protein